MQVVIPDIISGSQSAFIKGRRITDNMIIANELVRNFHLSSGAAKACLKVDLRKAYDSVNRQFIFHALLFLGFIETWILWIKACIGDPMVSILVNDRRILPISKRAATGRSPGPISFRYYYGGLYCSSGKGDDQGCIQEYERWCQYQNWTFHFCWSWFSLKVILSPWLPSFKFSKSSKLYLASLSAKKKRVSLTFTGPALVKPLSVRDLVSNQAASPLNTSDSPPTAFCFAISLAFRLLAEKYLSCLSSLTRNSCPS